MMMMMMMMMRCDDDDISLTHTAVSCLIFYIFMYGWCVWCVCGVCVHIYDDDVTESIFKMKIDNFLQYADRWTMMPSMPQFEAVSYALKKVCIGIIFFKNSTILWFYLFYEDLWIGNSVLKLLARGRFHFISERSCFSKVGIKLHEFWSRL